MLVRVIHRFILISLCGLLLAACAPPNASEPFFAPSDTLAARSCLSRGYQYFRRVYPQSAVCLHEHDGGPETTDAGEWLRETQPDVRLP